jgi:hypothetical protein
MSNGDPYWQFHCDRWLTGKINAFELDEQGLFLHFCMRAWVGQGAFDVCSTLVQREFNKSAEWVTATLDAFIDCGIVCRDGEYYRIKFIDDQLGELGEVREKRSLAGKASAAARLNTNQKADKRRAEKRREGCSTHLDTCSTPAKPRGGLLGLYDKIRTCRPEYAQMREMDVVTLLNGNKNTEAVTRMVDDWCMEQANASTPMSNPIASLRKRMTLLSTPSQSPNNGMGRSIE